MDQLSRNFEVICMQETHGGKEDFETAFPQISENFHLGCSRGKTQATGGEAVWVKKTLTAKGEKLMVKDVVPGRAVRLALSGQGRLLVCWSVHNFKLSRSQT